MKTGYIRKQRNEAFFCRNSTGAALERRRDCPFWERASQIYAFIILTVFPLLLSPRTDYDTTETKFYLFIGMTGLYALACLVIGFLYIPGRQRGFYLREKSRVKITVPQVMLFAYVLWGVISAIASPYSRLFIGQSRYEGVLSMLMYALAFMLLSFWGEYTDTYISGLGVMGTIMGFIAMVQSFGSTILYPGTYNYWNSEFLTTIGHQDCVAGMICILIPSLLCGYVILDGNQRRSFLPALFFMTYTAVFSDVDTAKIGFLIVLLMLPTLVESRWRLRRLLIGLVPVFLGFALSFTWRRNRSFAPGAAALLFLLGAVALGILAWYMERHERTWKLKPSTIRRVGYLIMLALLIVGLIVVYGYSGSNQLIREASELLHGELSDHAGSLRGYIWKSTLKLIAQNPILGGGPGCFISLFYPYDAGYQALMNSSEILVDFPHNDFLSVAACTGLVGFGLYLGFLISLAIRCLRRAVACPVLLILLAAMAGYLVYSFFVFSIAIVSPLFWVLAGVADKCVRQSDQARAPVAPAEGETEKTA